MSGILWEEPPRERLGRGVARAKHAVVAAALRERPGTWGVVGEYPDHTSSSSIAWGIRKARNFNAYAPAGAYEAMARAVDTVDDGVRTRHYRVYARYVGGEGA